MFAWFTGIKAYALVGVLALILSLGGVVYVQSLRLDAAGERIKRVETEKAELRDALAQSEQNNARLRELQAKLDVAVKEREKRAADLRKALGELDAQYEALEKSVAQEDRDCLSRRLPDSFAERLRDSAGSDENGSAASPGSPADRVPDSAAP